MPHEGMSEPNIHQVLRIHNVVSADFGDYTFTISKASSTDVIVQVFEGTVRVNEMQTQANVAISMLNQRYPELKIKLNSFRGVTVSDE